MSVRAVGCTSRSFALVLLIVYVFFAGEQGWQALPDPYHTQWERQMSGGHSHEGGSGGDQIVVGTGEDAEHLAHSMSHGATPESLKVLAGLGEQQGVPVDTLFGFIFDSMLNEGAVKQIQACKAILRKLYKSSPAKTATQRAILQYVQKLVTDSPHATVLLKKTPAILKALYDIDLLEEHVIVKWHAQGSKKAGAARKVRDAAEPFVNWLKEAEEESQDGSGSDEESNEE